MLDRVSGVILVIQNYVSNEKTDRSVCKDKYKSGKTKTY